MIITNGKINEELVQHIRNTSSNSQAIIDVTRLRQLEKIVHAAPKLKLKIMNSGDLKGTYLHIDA